MCVGHTHSAARLALAADLGPDVASYVVPFAYKIRFFFELSAREALHLLELRSGQGGHPDYRRVAQEMQKGYLLNERLIRPAMVIVSKAPDAARANGEA
mgnify:CR=1 FL=1